MKKVFIIITLVLLLVGSYANAAEVLSGSFEANIVKKRMDIHKIRVAEIILEKILLEKIEFPGFNQEEGNLSNESIQIFLRTKMGRIRFIKIIEDDPYGERILDDWSLHNSWIFNLFNDPKVFQNGTYFSNTLREIIPKIDIVWSKLNYNEKKGEVLTYIRSVWNEEYESIEEEERRLRWFENIYWKEERKRLKNEIENMTDVHILESSFYVFFAFESFHNISREIISKIHSMGLECVNDFEGSLFEFEEKKKGEIHIYVQTKTGRKDIYSNELDYAFKKYGYQYYSFTKDIKDLNKSSCSLFEILKINENNIFNFWKLILMNPDFEKDPETYMDRHLLPSKILSGFVLNIVLERIEELKQE